MVWTNERWRVHLIGINLVCVLWNAAAWWRRGDWVYALPVGINLVCAVWLWWHRR